MWSVSRRCPEKTAPALFLALLARAHVLAKAKEYRTSGSDFRWRRTVAQESWVPIATTAPSRRRDGAVALACNAGGRPRSSIRTMVQRTYTDLPSKRGTQFPPTTSDEALASGLLSRSVFAALRQQSVTAARLGFFYSRWRPRARCSHAPSRPVLPLGASRAPAPPPRPKAVPADGRGRGADRSGAVHECPSPTQELAETQAISAPLRCPSRCQDRPRYGRNPQ